MSSPEPVKPRSSLPIIAGLLVIGLLLLGGGFALRQAFPPKVEEAVAAADPAEATPEPAQPTSEPAPAPAEPMPTSDQPEAPSQAEAGDLRASIDDLANRLDQLQARVDEKPMTPMVDLKPIQDRLDEVARTTEGVAELPGTVEGLGKRLDAIEQEHKDLRAALDSIREQVQQAVAPAPAPAPTETEGDAAGEALAQGVELFKKGQYPQSLEQFRKATEAKPDDARAWYLAALANGLASRDWRGETERLVNRGVENERAGRPSASEIDASLADVVPENVRGWLSAYRKRAGGR